MLAILAVGDGQKRGTVVEEDGLQNTESHRRFIAERIEKHVYDVSTSVYVQQSV